MISRGELDDLSRFTIESIDSILPIQSYHFDVGNSNTGPVGYCGRINARSESHALAILRESLPVDLTIDPTTLNDEDSGGSVDYLSAYFNADAVTLKNLD